MTAFSILGTLLIGPLKLVFEIIYETAYRSVGHPGLAIIFLSLTINILVLPLYRRADVMQEEVRDKEAKLHDGVAHIKKVFSGDERMMILQTYYRQNHYKPTDALNGSVSLLLQIPFFIAAYQFLSHLELLKGVSLGPIADLGAPDGLLVIGQVTVNLLPILMTLINVISGVLYLKGFPLKTKIQVYGVALVFLVLLYASPSGLVFYWTLNNVFSLGKNIVYRLIKSAKESHIPNKNRNKHRQRNSELQPDGKLFLLGRVFLTILIGLLIPSVFIAISPLEYVDINYFYNPLWYIVNSFCMAAGTFLIWMRVFYWLAGPKGKVVFDRLVWILCGMTIVNYMFFGTDLGVISSTLQYNNDMSFTLRQQLINLLILVVLAAILYLVICKWKRIAADLLFIAIAALVVISAVNLNVIKAYVGGIYVQEPAKSEEPHFPISKTGRNVIVIMLDRAMGGYIPYLFREKPELVEQFAGFTYYENTISFGGHTNFGSPALFGGYEYTPVEINKRTEELLVSKHNESLKVMPAIFAENGYDVTVCDPAYANYQWIPDLRIYNDYPNVSAYITKGRFGGVEEKQAVVDQNTRNFFCFSVMKTMPLFMQPTFYSRGRYYQVGSGSAEETASVSYVTQVVDSMSLSTGMNADFIASYNVLVNLPGMTEVTESENNTFLLMTNNTTHEQMLLREPEYIPAQNVDNTVYDAENADRFVTEDRELRVMQSTQMMHYHSNMATMIQLGNWFDYLRENDVYDNTRIILVSDHGYPLAQHEELIMDDGSDDTKDAEFYYPLLMVKDFNSEEFVTSDTFMTNADVPALAMEDIISDPINPFTGNSINSEEKNAHDQFIILSEEWHIDSNNDYTFSPARWASVKDDIWNKDNWRFYDEPTVLDEHVMP